MRHRRAGERSAVAATARAFCRGFTLVEILVTISIILLLLGLALPAFRVITGGRSEQGATNQVSAMLGRARADAVGLQIPRGVAFYTDATGQCRMAEVGAVVFTPWNGTVVSYPTSSYVSYTPAGGATGYYISTALILAATGNVSPDKDTTGIWHHYLDTGNTPPSTDAAYAASGTTFYDQLPDTDSVALPLGVGAQTIADSGVLAGGQRTTDGYLHDGAIVFDASGRLTQQPLIFSRYGTIGLAVALGANVGNNSSGACLPLASQFGLVVYDRDAHDSQNFPLHDPTFDSAVNYTTGTPSPLDEETWLDVNATPLLINRYNGTLIRGE